MIQTSQTGPRRVMSLFDAICIMVGTIVGAGIFESAPMIAEAAGGVVPLFGLWILGGLLTLVGALCFAELTTSQVDLPGGDYGYLKLAFGRRVAFLFAWATFWIIRPGNIGAMALTFANYFERIWVVDANAATSANGYQLIYALLAVLVLSAMNLTGLRYGKGIQNVLTLAKIAGALAIVGLAFSGPAEAAVVSTPSDNSPDLTWLLAMVLIMFSFGGWNDVSFIATEIRNPKRNLLWALVAGTVLVTAIYIVLNWSFIHALGYESMAQSQRVATDVVRATLGSAYWGGQRGAQIVAALICVSCLGAINGIIITSPRIYYATGKDYLFLQRLGVWDRQRDQPGVATIVQAVVTIGLFSLCFLYDNPFLVVVVVSAPFFWAFLGLTGISLIILRRRSLPNAERPDGQVYRVPWFPVLPLIFATSCFLMAFASIRYVCTQELWLASSLLIFMMLVGIVLGSKLRPSPDGGD